MKSVFDQKLTRVCVLGATGFVGEQVVRQLSLQNYSVRMAVKRPERFRQFNLLPDVQLFTVESEYNEAFFKNCFKDVDVVINLFADQTCRTESVADDQLVNLAQMIKQVAEQGKVKRVIQLSQIGANASQAANSWLKQLGEADAITHNMASISTTIFRPGLLIGQGDCTTSLYAKQLSSLGFAFMPNASIEVQPLWVKDFAKALVLSINDRRFHNAKLEVVGDERMTIKDLAEWVKTLMDMDKAMVMPMCQLNAKFMLLLGPLAPFKSVTPYQQKILALDLVSAQSFSEQFGFEPASLEFTLASYVANQPIKQRLDYFRQLAGRNQGDFR
ncbi:NAD(P)H-binding protein [Thiomicrospira microaerophila]|uniref:SDR family oxidoreductase n=1 Tax=Thiomicrospira microaerophila TaxID=406020 RepID=UPI00200D0575|nr:NAD(P)H-binding protein [Thiomicrospira microaerophila]UQB42457.1 NAD(P)H-binding protein [Thiomicrospira microaerophila]